MSVGFFRAAGTASGPARPSIVPACGACGLYRTCSSPKQGYRGDGRKEVLLVASSPSNVDGGAERPFGGSYGPDLRRALGAVGLDMERDCWQIGAVACRPPRGRFPAADEVQHCNPLFRAAVAELKPKVIIAFGYAAAQAATAGAAPPGVGPEQWPGWHIPDQQHNAWICPTWHPAEVAHHKETQVMSLIFGHHLEEAARRAAKGRRPWGAAPPDWGAQVRRYYADEEAAAAVRAFAAAAASGREAVAFDYETNMLKPDPAEARIVSCGLARGRRAPVETIAFPWGPLVRVAVGELLRSPLPKLGANIKFEDRWTRKEFGHRVRAWAWDAVNEAHVLDNRPNITSVKFQSYVLLGQPDYGSEVKPFFDAPGTMTPNKINQLDMRRLLRYNGLDAFLEFMLAIRQAALLSYPLPWLQGD